MVNTKTTATGLLKGLPSGFIQIDSQQPAGPLPQ
jgi:hypothetical protein